MKTKSDNNFDDFLLSGKPTPMPFLEYQAVFFIKGDVKCLRSFNILQHGKLVKKIYLQKMISIDEVMDIQQVILDYLLKGIADPDLKSEKHNGFEKNSKSGKPIPNPEARARASSNLFSNLGL